MQAFYRLGLAEDERLEYKRELGPKVAMPAAAMANTRGGTVLVGVEEDSKTKVPKSWEGLSGDVRGALTRMLWTRDSAKAHAASNE